MSSKKRLFTAFFLFSMIFFVSSCGLLFAILIPEEITDLKVGTSIDGEGNLSGEATVFSNVRTLYIRGKASGQLDDIYGLAYINGLYYRSMPMSYWTTDTHNAWSDYEISATLTSTRASEYLPVGEYYIKINGAGESYPPYEGGELTFNISDESS